ncbi:MULTISPECIES: hypothetical protein [Cupriavidus]
MTIVRASLYGFHACVIQDAARPDTSADSTSTLSIATPSHSHSAGCTSRRRHGRGRRAARPPCRTTAALPTRRQPRRATQGRGSTANSTVCHCSGITEVDPRRGNPLFEQFISTPPAGQRTA